MDERDGRGGAPGADLAADGRRRGDGRGAAARRVQPEHQGAGRLLGRAVHRRRRAARAGRAHPGPPRVDARRRCAPRSTRAATRSGPATRSSLNDPYAGGTHLNDVTLVAPCFVDGRDRRLGREPGAPRGPRRHGAGLDAARRGAHRAGGPADPAGAALRRGRGRARRVVAHARGAPRRPRRAGRREPARRRPPRRARGRAVRRRSSTTASAGCGPRCAALPDGRWRAEDVLDSTGPRPEQQHPARIALELVIDGDEVTFDFTGTDEQRAGHGERGRGGDRQRGRVRAADRDGSDDPGQRRRAAAGAGDRAARARSSRRSSRPRSARATSR